mmetsp:Transcript_28750/g.66778  ORF Transcript_28750/g.66778 Transcript_28750/m.66778 type:complete len:218 (-) Transcript_28750:2965-3618(-)
MLFSGIFDAQALQDCVHNPIKDVLTHSLHAAVEAQVLSPCDALPKWVSLWAHAELRGRLAPALLGLDVIVEDEQPPCRCFGDFTCQQSYACGLSSAIGAQQAETLALPHRQGDATNSVRLGLLARPPKPTVAATILLHCDIGVVNIFKTQGLITGCAASSAQYILLFRKHIVVLQMSLKVQLLCGARGGVSTGILESQPEPLHCHRHWRCAQGQSPQ